MVRVEETHEVTCLIKIKEKSYGRVVDERESSEQPWAGRSPVL